VINGGMAGTLSSRSDMSANHQNWGFRNPAEWTML
jgi:hypothetical protein